MHQLLGIAVPIEDNPTEEEAICIAENFADTIIEERHWWDCHEDHKETVEEWKDDAKTFRTDTEDGRRRLNEIKDVWKAIVKEQIKTVRDVLEKEDDEIINDWNALWKISRVRHKSESPLWGEEFGYIDSLKGFDAIKPSWIIFLDFHC